MISVRKKYKIFLLLAMLIVSNNSIGQKPLSDKSKLSNFEFDSIFGTRLSGDEKSVYCLLGQGFFRAPRRDDVDNIIREWIKAHPNASLIPVSGSYPVMEQEPDTRFVYCWIVDGSDTLNIKLIREGAFPGGTMIRPMRRNNDTNSAKKENIDTEFYVDEAIYNVFLEKIRSAEQYARENEAGIWGNNEL